MAYFQVRTVGFRKCTLRKKTKNLEIHNLPTFLSPNLLCFALTLALADIAGKYRCRNSCSTPLGHQAASHSHWIHYWIRLIFVGDTIPSLNLTFSPLKIGQNTENSSSSPMDFQGENVSFMEGNVGRTSTL